MGTRTIRRGAGTRSGFTLVEVTITSVIMVIVGLAIGVVIVDGQTGWNTMYDHINADVVTDGYVARKKFDTVIRNASSNKFLLPGDGSWIEVYYYADASSTTTDRYARFYVADGDLKIEYGQLGPRETISTETLGRNVSHCTFEQAGASVQMTLKLDDGMRTNAIVTSAVAHNR